MNARLLRLRDFDPILLASALGLVALGSLLIYSGSLTRHGAPEGLDLSHPVVRQGLFAAVGLAGALVIARVDYKYLGALSGVLYLASVGALGFVLVFGESVFGSRRWILIGDVLVQPSEVAKLLTIVVLAKYLSDREESVGTVRVLVTSLAIAALPGVLVFAEPDLGSAVIFGAIWLGMVTVAGAKWRHLATMLAITLIAVPFVFMVAVQDYQRERISVWLDAEQDPLGSGWNILQGQIGIGSGGLWGKGLTEGSQTQLDFVRTQTTDYIFSVLGEELGFVGALVLFGLFFLLLWRAIRVAEVSRDMFGRLIATGIVIFIMLQTFINVAVNVGLLPVTGIPLPFISQGGSSLITLLLAIGLLESVVLRHRRATFRDFFS
ncbi:MAG: rod shape-determining protein RodA [Dehalococcoidia bacterium]